MGPAERLFRVSFHQRFPGPVQTCQECGLNSFKMFPARGLQRVSGSVSAPTTCLETAPVLWSWVAFWASQPGWACEWCASVVGGNCFLTSDWFDCGSLMVIDAAADGAAWPPPARGGVQGPAMPGYPTCFVITAAWLFLGRRQHASNTP